jgi:hypothetical protein
MLFDLPNDLQKDVDDFDIYRVDPGHYHLFTAINKEGGDQKVFKQGVVL